MGSTDCTHTLIRQFRCLGEKNAMPQFESLTHTAADEYIKMKHLNQKQLGSDVNISKYSDAVQGV